MYPTKGFHYRESKKRLALEAELAKAKRAAENWKKKQKLWQLPAALTNRRRQHLPLRPKTMTSSSSTLKAMRSKLPGWGSAKPRWPAISLVSGGGKLHAMLSKEKEDAEAKVA